MEHLSPHTPFIPFYLMEPTPLVPIMEPEAFDDTNASLDGVSARRSAPSRGATPLEPDNFADARIVNNTEAAVISLLGEDHMDR